jgi:hypothetical protein
MNPQKNALMTKMGHQMLVKPWRRYLWGYQGTDGFHQPLRF